DGRILIKEEQETKGNPEQGTDKPKKKAGMTADKEKKTGRPGNLLPALEQETLKGRDHMKKKNKKKKRNAKKSNERVSEGRPCFCFEVCELPEGKAQVAQNIRKGARLLSDAKKGDG